MPILRVATYNVHGAVGRDGQCRPDRQLEVLRSIDADIVALQEFVEHPSPGRTSLLAHWAEALKLEDCRFAPAFERGGEIFGNALLSRYPV